MRSGRLLSAGDGAATYELLQAVGGVQDLSAVLNERELPGVSEVLEGAVTPPRQLLHLVPREQGLAHRVPEELRELLSKSFSHCFPDEVLEGLVVGNDDVHGVGRIRDQEACGADGMEGVAARYSRYPLPYVVNPAAGVVNAVRRLRMRNPVTARAPRPPLEEQPAFEAFPCVTTGRRFGDAELPGELDLQRLAHLPPPPRGVDPRLFGEQHPHAVAERLLLLRG